MRKSKSRFRYYKDRIIALVKHPFFWVLTAFGNILILLGSLLLYFFESPISKLDFLDCILWSTGVVTTIGYGDYVAVTTGGRLSLLVLMLLGTLFVWTYMAFLVTALIAPELSSLEKEVQDVEHELRDLKLEKKEDQSLT